MPTAWILLAGPLLAAARAAGKWAAVRYGGSALRLTGFPPDAGLGSVAQGGVVMALALNFLLMSGARDSRGGAAVLTTVVLGVACALLAAPALMALALRERADAAEPAPLTAVAEPAELTVNAPAEWPR